MPETERTNLEPISENDVEFLSEFYGSSINTKFIPAPSGSISELVKKRIDHWDKYGFGTYIVKSKGTGCRIGYIGIEYIGTSMDADIRYGLVSEVWGKGLGLEVAKECLRLAISEFSLKKVWAATIPENIASFRILQSIGMNPDPEFKHYGNEVVGYSYDVRK